MDPTGKKTKGDRGMEEYGYIDYIDKYRWRDSEIDWWTRVYMCLARPAAVAVSEALR